MKFSKLLATSLITGVVGLVAFLCTTSVLAVISPWFMFMFLQEPWAALMTFPAVRIAMAMTRRLIRDDPYASFKVWMMGIIGLGIVRLCEAALLRMIPFDTIYDVTFIITRLVVAIVAAFIGLSVAQATTSYLVRQNVSRRYYYLFILMFVVIDAVILTILATLPQIESNFS